MIVFKSRRGRVLLHLLLGVLLTVAVRPGLGSDGVAQEKAQPGAPAAGTGQDTETAGTAVNDTASDKASLIVVVVGNGKPVRDAAVEVRSRSSDRVMSRGVTDKNGTATFSFAVLGTKVMVLVIEDGWQSTFKEAVLSKGTQKLTIQLKPLADAIEGEGVE